VRLSLDRNKQPSRNLLLESFDLQLKKLNKEHPYELESENRKKFRETFLGNSAAALSASFLYRLKGLKSLVRGAEGVRPLSVRPEEEIFREMLREHRAVLRNNPESEGWLRLAAYVTGDMRGLRGIDFWTDFPLLSTDLTESAYRVGLPREYHPPDPLVLRWPCRLGNATADFKVPTVLDGYDHGPFFAAPDHLHPTSGHTIDLNHVDRLKEGVSEYVTPDLPVDAVEFIPIDWQRKSDPQRWLTDNPSLIQTLILFLQSRPNA
jgi:hypothetical protein